MKKISKIILIVTLLFSSIIVQKQATAQQVNVNFSAFQNSLSPYGRWVNHGTYGQVWIANTPQFVPYQTGGHWAYTDYGWTWVSDYDWGWAPFHYGRWAYENGFGWYWVPGYDWAPAWVAWRNNNDYYGWAPLAPGLNISIGASYGNQIPYDRWVFAPHQYINSPYVSRYYVPRARNVTIIKNTTVINNVNVRNNVNYVSGPRREDVERVNHAKIQTYTVANSARPGRTVINNNTVNVYRPVINKNNVAVNNTTVNNNNRTVVNRNNVAINKNDNIIRNNNAKTVNGNNAVNRNVPNSSIEKNNNTVINNNRQQAIKAHSQTLPANNLSKQPVREARPSRPQANVNVPNHVQQNHLNTQPKPMVNNRPQMQRPAPQPHPNAGGGHDRKPGR